MAVKLNVEFYFSMCINKGLPTVQRAELALTLRIQVSPIRRWNVFMPTLRRKLTLKRMTRSTRAKFTKANYCQFWVPAEHFTHLKVSCISRLESMQQFSSGALVLWICWIHFFSSSILAWLLWDSTGHGLIWWETYSFEHFGDDAFNATNTSCHSEIGLHAIAVSLIKENSSQKFTFRNLI